MPISRGGNSFVEEDGRPPASRAGRVLRRLDRGVSHAVELVAAALVVAEVVVLGVSTAARYLFAHPFPWSDELATYMFIWLAVLGAVVALRRGEHMRLTAFLRGISPDRRAWLEFGGDHACGGGPAGAGGAGLGAFRIRSARG